MKKILLFSFVLFFFLPATSQESISDSLLTSNMESVIHFRMYPNPVEYDLNLEFNLDYSGEVTMLIMDGKGEIVFNQELDYTKGIYEKPKLKLGHLDSGVYYLNMRFGEKQVVRRFNKRYLRK